MTAPISPPDNRSARVLHVDIEGGWGGSSRSLYELIRCLDRRRIVPLVAHRQRGPIEARYRALGVPTAHVPTIGSFVPRAEKCARNFVASLPRLAKLPTAAAQLTALARSHRADLIHLNYEGLFLLAPKLKRRLNLPIVCHCRALLPTNPWGRWLANKLRQCADHLFFISPQEAERFAELVDHQPHRGTVVWNIAGGVDTPQTMATPPEAVYLGSIDPFKGTDRLIDIAVALARAKSPPLIIAVYGENRARPGYRAALERQARDVGVADRIVFRGHTAEPERAIAGALAVIRPSRGNDPWGRDVIEATALGVPVLATGSYDGVVAPGRTGYLYDPFDADAMAAQLVRMATNPTHRAQLSQAARAKGAARFGGGAQARTVTDIFLELAALRDTDKAAA